MCVSLWIRAISGDISNEKQKDLNWKSGETISLAPNLHRECAIAFCEFSVECKHKQINTEEKT